MTFQVFSDKAQGKSFVVAVVLIPICVAATVLRFYVSRLPGRKIGLEDWFALLALLAYLTYTGCNLWILVHLNGKSLFQLGKLPMATVINIYKAGYVMNMQTALNQTFAKLSLLTLYHRVFNVERFIRYAVYVTAVVQILWGISMVAARIFLCAPIKKAWTPTMKKGHCIDSQILLAAGDAINSAIDFFMIGLALMIVAKLHVSKASKWKIGILFAIGGFSGVIGIIKIAITYGHIGSNIENASWNMAQQATSIICCCFPIYKPLFQQFHNFQKRVFTKLSSNGSKKSQESGSSSPQTLPKYDSEKGSGQDNVWFPLDNSSDRQLGQTDPVWGKNQALCADHGPGVAKVGGQQE